MTTERLPRCPQGTHLFPMVDATDSDPCDRCGRTLVELQAEDSAEADVRAKEWMDRQAALSAAAAGPPIAPPVYTAGVGRRPEIKPEAGRFVHETGQTGVPRPVWKPPVAARPAGPLSVTIYAYDRETGGALYCTAEEAEAFAAELLQQARNVRELARAEADAALQAAVSSPVPEVLREKPDERAMVRDAPGGQWRRETDQEFSEYLRARMRNLALS